MEQNSQVYCTQCGAPGFAADQFCRQCGQKRSTEPLRGHSSPPTGVPAPSGRGRFGPPPPQPPGYTPPSIRDVLSPAPYHRSNHAGDQARENPAPQHAEERALTPARYQTLAFSGMNQGSLAAPPPLMPVAVLCPHCSMPLPTSGGACASCGWGKALALALRCARCGASNPTAHRYCGRCGAALPTNPLVVHRSHSSALPVVGSMILPGLGQMMNGDAIKGFVLLGIALLLLGHDFSIFHPVYLLITLIAATDAAISRPRRPAPAPVQARDWA